MNRTLLTLNIEAVFVKDKTLNIVCSDITTCIDVFLSNWQHILHISHLGQQCKLIIHASTINDRVLIPPNCLYSGICHMEKAIRGRDYTI